MKTKKLLMLFASVAVLTACSSDDPFDSVNNMVPPAVNGGGGGMVNGGGGTSGSTAATGELLTFDVAIDKTSAEPTSTVSAYYPETTDDISTQAFTTKVTIDMANPVAKTENGVEITVNEGHVTANHGSTEGVCYVVSGTTTNGSLTIEGSTDFEVNLSDANINNPASTALDLESKMAAYLVLSGTNKLTDGTTEDHKGALYSKGKLLISGDGALEVYGTYNNGIHSKSYVVIDKGVNLYVNTTVAFLDEKIGIYVARDLEKGNVHWDEEEELGIEAWNLEDLKQLIYEGKMTDGKTVAAIMTYAEKYCK